MVDKENRKKWVGKSDVLMIHYQYSCSSCGMVYDSLSAIMLSEGPLCPFCGKAKLDYRRLSKE